MHINYQKICFLSNHIYIDSISSKLYVTNSSTAKQEEKQEERGSCQPLQASSEVKGLL